MPNGPSDADAPRPTGYAQEQPTLCVGLDIAWYGGSANDPASQHDCLAAALLGPEAACDFRRVKLLGRDPEGELTFGAIENLREEFGRRASRVVVAIDAPLQSIDHPIPSWRQKVRRASDRALSRGRMRIDRQTGGSRGWHPNIQPGFPLAPRVASLLAKLERAGFACWTPERSQAAALAFECFPAEAIWFARKRGAFPADLTASEAKAYKKTKGRRLTADEVRTLVETVLRPNHPASASSESLWKRVVESAVEFLLQDESWKLDGGLYRGGKLLDDAVDSAICLAAAISYAHDAAHVWRDPDRPDDGHIIGPGRYPAET